MNVLKFQPLFLVNLLLAASANSEGLLSQDSPAADIQPEASAQASVDSSLPRVGYHPPISATPFIVLLLFTVVSVGVFEILHIRWSGIDFAETVEEPDQTSVAGSTAPFDLRKMARLISPYFRSKRGHFKGRLFVTILLLLGGASVAISYLVNDIISRYWDAIESKDWSLFLSNLCIFVLLIASEVLLQAYTNYLESMFLIDWRTHATKRYQQLWLSNHAYYRIQMVPGPLGEKNIVDNPDQRIAADVNTFTSSSWLLLYGFLDSTGTILVFLPLLWRLSPATFPGTSFVFPGWLLYCCLFYCVIGSVITHWIGQKLILVQYSSQRYEADYRSALIRVGALSETIALTQAEGAESTRLGVRFDKVRRMVWEAMFVNKRLAVFRSVFHYGGELFPLFILSPAFFSGAITLGHLNQTFHAVRRILSSMQFFVNVYSDIISWRAAGNRLAEFEHVMIYVSKKKMYPSINTIYHDGKKGDDRPCLSDVEDFTTVGQLSSDEVEDGETNGEMNSIASMFALRSSRKMKDGGRREKHEEDVLREKEHLLSPKTMSTIKESKQSCLQLIDVTVFRPPPAAKKLMLEESLWLKMVDKVSLTVNPGDWVLISGKEGSGKTSLLRTMAGVWPYVGRDGLLVLPRDRHRIVFVSSCRNRLREDFGSIHESLLYNVADKDRLSLAIDTALAIYPREIERALAAVGLSKLLLPHKGTPLVPKGLSAGEAQRLELASAILRKPDWLFLDEATCHMSPGEQVTLLGGVKEALSGSTAVVSVSHSVELSKVHNKHYELRESRASSLSNDVSSCLVKV